jgi:hypothetical protein
LPCWSPDPPLPLLRDAAATSADQLFVAVSVDCLSFEQANDILRDDQRCHRLDSRPLIAGLDEVMANAAG